MMKKQIGRKKAAARNIMVTLAYQGVVILLGFVIPRLFLTTYGPSIHGLTSSITNLMSYVLLLNAGLNTASIQSMYEPLSKGDAKRTNEVLNAIKHYYTKLGIAFCLAVALLAFAFPLFVRDVSSGTVSALMLVMGLQSIFDSLFISKNRILLQADQKLYIVNAFGIITLLLRGIIQTLLIMSNASVIIVQAIPALMLLVTMCLQELYVRKHYPMLDGNVKADTTALSKRGAAFIHQIAGLVVNNTDVLLLTVITGDMILVSIYSVYQLVFRHLSTLMTSVFSQGTVAGFGHLIVIGSKERLISVYSVYEFLYFNVVSIIYSVCAVMILPFVSLYTDGIEGVPYVDAKLAGLFVIIGVLNNLRVPGGTLINAGGYYKETQWRAVTEALINLCVSLLLIKPLGIYGVLLGTVMSFLYRTVDIIVYSNKIILKKSAKNTFFRCVRVFTILVINLLLFKFLSLTTVNWIDWIATATIVTITATLITVLLSFASEPSHIKNIFLLFRDLQKARR